VSFLIDFISCLDMLKRTLITTQTISSFEVFARCINTDWSKFSEQLVFSIMQEFAIFFELTPSTSEMLIAGLALVTSPRIVLPYIFFEQSLLFCSEKKVSVTALTLQSHVSGIASISRG
jgi:hypothetical protein